MSEQADRDVLAEVLGEHVEFWALVDLGERWQCWNWLGSLTVRQGYGQFSAPGHRTVRAHRYAYELARGPIPDGLVLDHLCRTRSCVNPWHLEPVTNQTNVLRGIGPTALNARKTHCKRGHEFTADNTHIDRRGRRLCRTCRRDRARKARAEGRAYSQVGMKFTCPVCGKSRSLGQRSRHLATHRDRADRIERGE